MRLAVSAVTGLSGLVLLGLAIYGQPAVYVHVAREHLADWFHEEHEAYLTRRTVEDDKMPERMAALQQQVAALQAELAQRQAAAQSQVPAAQRSPASVPTPAPVNTVAVPPPMSPAPVMPSQPGRPAVPDAPQPLTRSIGASVPASGSVASPTAPGDGTGSSVPASEKVGSLSVTPPVTGLATPLPERRDPGSAKSGKKPGLATDQDVFTAEGTAPKSAAKTLRPPPARRPDVDDSQSVLARLRGGGPAPVPAPRTDSTAAAVSPAAGRLTAAQAALNAGRTDDAVRLLQEVQLQLVFRPVDAPGGDPEAAGQGASDVARALEALSANNVPASIGYVNRALGDISGNKTNPGAAVSAAPVLGYAPAYPSR